ncbi:MAG: helix-hairpin-helix domain-containing protein [Campylobacterota bacterium]|nr:helix-hairpin-helix domain-containing protein [Campylobacterota bacterium]
MSSQKKLPKVGLLYLDYVLRFFDKSNFRGWPDKIEVVTYHWGKDKDRFIKEVKRKKIEVLVGNIPATAYDTFREIAAALPNVRFIPSVETQYSNKSKENVTRFCKKYDIAIPRTEIFYDKKEGDNYLKKAKYPQIVKRSYGPSNYGGYYVHKVDSYKEAAALFAEKKYVPIYTQDAIDLKDSGDVRVMLIGHKPVCAFWRYSGTGEWITNTSQGGSMSYENVSMDILELAVKASKAAKAEYWACDIAVCAKTNKPYILECATAFAAFPYIRDWICQYIMWDISNGKFRKPFVPLYSWEQLGKMDPNVLRTLRHLYFSQHDALPSVDGAFFVERKDAFNMELTDESNRADISDLLLQTLQESDLPKVVTAPDQDENEFEDYAVATEDTDTKELEIEEDDNKISINSASVEELITLPGMGEKTANQVVEKREETPFTLIDELKKLKGFGKKSFEKIMDLIKV